MLYVHVLCIGIDFGPRPLGVRGTQFDQWWVSGTFLDAFICAPQLNAIYYSVA